MSIAGFEELERALHRRGDPLSVEQFLDVVAESVAPSAALTQGERSFLLEHTDLEPGDLGDEARARTRLARLEERRRAEAAAESSSLTTQEVSELLGRAESNVRRSRLNGDLYAVSMGVGGRALRFPRWQFRDGAVVPGLRRILGALPADFHPLDVEAFMTSSHELLDGSSPVDWLVTGGPADVVVSLAEELDRQ